MNNINVTVELCAEDRARLDKIIGLLDARACLAQFAIEQEYDKPDEVQKALADCLARTEKANVAEAPKNAQDEPKASDHPTLDPFPERPTAQAEPSEAPEEKAEPTVSTSELQQLVIALCRVGKKDKVREVVSTYGVQTVAAIPESKRTEVFQKLKALEG